MSGLIRNYDEEINEIIKNDIFLSFLKKYGKKSKLINKIAQRYEDRRRFLLVKELNHINFN